MRALRASSILLTLSALAIGACVLDRTGTSPDTSGAGGGVLTSSSSMSNGPMGSTTTAGTTTSGSTSTVAASSGAGGATTTSTSATTSTSGGAEDCSNGVDDNGDGQIDCDDPACSGLETLPVVNGAPYGTLDDASCPSGKVSAGDACGNDCGCTPVPGFCGATVQIFDNQGCNQGLKYNNPHGNGCHAMGITAASGQNLGYIATAGEFQAATCVPGNASGAPHAFCELTVHSYTNKSMQSVVCTTSALSCVQLPGDQPCPNGYKQRQEKISAQGCACTCAASQDCTAEQVSLCDSNCNSCGNNLKVDGKCHDAGVDQLGNIDWSQPNPSTAMCSDTPPPVQFTVCCAK